MTRQTLQDARYKTIGYIETLANGDQLAMDDRFRTVGHYRASGNVTLDAQYRTVGHGNLLASLIR